MSEDTKKEYDAREVALKLFDKLQKIVKEKKPVEEVKKSEDMDLEKHIKHEDGKWNIYSHDFSKKLGSEDSKEAAVKRLGQIEYFKTHKSEDIGGDLEKKEKSDKFERCVMDVKEKQGGRIEGKVNPFAVCHTSVDKSEVEPHKCPSKSCKVCNPKQMKKSIESLTGFLQKVEEKRKIRKGCK
jgi:hypothetical protein